MPDYLTNLLRRPPVGWWDVLDIAIVSLLIYEFLKLIRGTRAVQMALGSFLIVGLFYVSRLAYDLLVTICNRGSPLYGGAVNLQEGRKAPAACFLPLTVNPRLSRDLG